MISKMLDASIVILSFPFLKLCHHCYFNVHNEIDDDMDTSYKNKSEIDQ